MKKREQAAHALKNIEDRLQCTICGVSLTVVELSRLVCHNNHSFDLAKQGYVNMLQKQVTSMYDQSLFNARHNIISTYKLYDKVHDKIADIINNNLKDEGLIFDAGSGEGSHLHSIIKKTNRDNLYGLGLDISKAGVMMAGKHYPEQNWIVGDLSRTPFKDDQVDLILSYLSPSNYEEFSRIISPSGILIKVIPGSEYLKEIREVLTVGNQQYENTDTLELMKRKVNVVSEERITYGVELNQQALRDLMNMTPLAWHASDADIEAFAETGPKITTVDLHIIQARF